MIKLVSLLMLVSVTSFFSCKNEGTTQKTEVQIALQKELDGVLRSFIETVGMAGFDTTLRPSVEVKNTPNLIFYSFDTKTVVVPEWTSIPDEFKDLFNSWATSANSDDSDYTGESFTGEHYFRETFSWFFVFHELGHYIQDINEREGDLYLSEKEANEIALAFLKINQRTRLDAYMSLVRAVRDILPVPADTSRTYFNENYDAIGLIPAVYGYFQFTFTIDAYENRIDELDLNDFL